MNRQGARAARYPDAFLSRTDLRELGLERRAVDAVFRKIAAGPGVIVLEGYRRPLIRVGNFRDLLERSTFTGERVRWIARRPLRLIL